MLRFPRPSDFGAQQDTKAADFGADHLTLKSYVLSLVFEHVYLHCMQYLNDTTLVIFTLKITACNDITYTHGIKPGVSK